MADLSLDPDMRTLDLAMEAAGTVRTLRALLDGKVLGPVPAEGGLRRLAASLAREDPERFGREEATAQRLAGMHLQFLMAGRNGAGRAYPDRDLPSARTGDR